MWRSLAHVVARGVSARHFVRVFITSPWLHAPLRGGVRHVPRTCTYVHLTVRSTHGPSTVSDCLSVTLNKLWLVLWQASSSMAAKRKAVLVSSSSDSEEDLARGELSARSGDGLSASSSHGVAKSSINHARAVSVNPPEKRAKDAKPGWSPMSLKKKSLWDRLKEYPEEKLVLESGRIFCKSCSEPLSAKKSTIASHVASKKHQKGKEQLERTRAHAQTLVQTLQQYDKKVHPVGERLPLDVRTWRMEVVEGFLSAGIPLYKIDGLRHLLERNNCRLTHSSHMSDLVPPLLEKEVGLLKDELRHPSSTPQKSLSRDVSLIFDGSTRLGEAVAIVVRFVNDAWEIKQRLLKIEVLASSLKAAELAQVINGCMVDFTIQGSSIVGCMRDGASVNQAAVDILGNLWPPMFNGVCFSRAIDLVGDHFDTPTLDTFSQHWISLFSHSPRARLRWREQTGKAIKTHSETRWWSKWEVLNQLCEYFGDLQRFLDENEDVSPKTMDHLRVILADPDRSKHLELELAALIDVGQHFVKATYRLEGDGPLVFSTFRSLQELLTACNVAHHPNIQAVAQKLADGDEEMATDLEQWAKQRVQPGVFWFLQKFHGEGRGGLRPMLEAFKLARYFCPVQVQALQPTAADVNLLRHFPFLRIDNVIRGLQDELPAYLAEVDGCRLSTDEEKVAWWRDHSDSLPKWASAVRQVLLLQPSSAAAERVFSLLRAAFNEQQECALQDYLEASVMLRYNKR